MTATGEAPRREITVVTAEVNELKRQAQTMALTYAIEIGRRLAEAKSILPHGEWGNWLRDEVEFSQSTAGNYMRLFEAYGDRQLSLFGIMTDSKSLAGLDYTKALKLLAVPEGERESFAAEVGAENLSVRELEAAIRERNEARERAAELEERAAAAEAAAEKAAAMAAESDALKERADAAEKELARKMEELGRTNARLNEALANPAIPDAEKKKIEKAARAEGAEAAKQQAAAELEKAQKQAAGAEAARREAEAAAQKAAAELDEARRRMKAAAPEVAAFKALFESVQTQFDKLRGLLDQVRKSDAKTADGLTRALTAMLDAWREAITP